MSPSVRSDSANRHEPRHFVPALGHDWLTPAYDALIRLTMPERRFKQELIAQARIGTGDVVLDLGCGTATLTLLAKQQHPYAQVIGVDGDAKILEHASRKIRREALDVPLHHALAVELPYRPQSFDKVLSSLVLHHLSTEEKRRALAECYRVLRRGGELHIADWDKPHNAVMWLVSRGVRLVDGARTTEDSLKGLLPQFCREAGFRDVERTLQLGTAFGTLTFFRALR